MIDLKKIKMPSAVVVDGIFYEVKTDFSFWLQFESNLKNNDFNFYFLFDGVRPPISKHQETYDALIEFYQPKRTLPRAIGKGSNVPVMDFDLDAELIYSAFMDCYGIDLLNPDLHLHIYKFQALLSGLHDTKFNEVISYRSFNKNDKTKYEVAMENLKRSWELPLVESEEEKKAREEFNSLFEVKK